MLELQVDDDVHGLVIARLTPAGQDVEDDLVADRSCAEGLGDCGFYNFEAVIGNGGQDAHEAAIRIIALTQLAPQLGEYRWKVPVLEGSAVPQGPGLART